MATGKVETTAKEVSFKHGGKQYNFENDEMVECTRPDGEPALVPAWRLKDLLFEREFKIGYPAKKKAPAKKDD